MNQFRFKIAIKDEPDQWSEWIEETKSHGQHSNAVDAIEQVRQEFPDAAISIERRVKPKEEAQVG